MIYISATYVAKWHLATREDIETVNYQYMLKALEISLIITAIHVSMWDSMIFRKIAIYLQRLPRWTHKPLFECLICMGGCYTLIL